MADGRLSSEHRLTAADSETDWGDDAFGGAEPSEFLALTEFQGNPNVETIPDETERATHSGRPHDTYEGDASPQATLHTSGIIDPDGSPSLPLGTILKAANFEETVDAEAPSFSYDLITGDVMATAPSLTWVNYLLEKARSDARKMVYTGYRGNIEISCEHGQPLQIQTQGTSQYAEWPNATVAKPDDPTEYQGEANRLHMVGANIELEDEGQTVHDVAVTALQLNTNWEVVDERDGTTADTTLSRVYLVRPTDSRPEGSVTLAGRSAALEEILPAIKSGAVFSLTATFENSNGDRLTIESPALQFGNYGLQRDTHVMFQVPIFLNGQDAGENDLTLTFDRAS